MGPACDKSDPLGVERSWGLPLAEKTAVSRGKQLVSGSAVRRAALQRVFGVGKHWPAHEDQPPGKR
jgi:hypothetical protein